MKRVSISAALLVACLLAREAGLRPRQTPKDYPSQGSGESASVGAAVLPAAQVKRGFATALDKEYLVVEVALYPGADGRLEVSRDDFEIHAGSQAALHPVSPQAIAAALQRPVDTRRNSSGKDIAVYPTVGVGYETGRGGYDPVTGRSRGGWTTSTGVGVGVGNTGPSAPPPASTDRDRGVMIAELEDKALPEGPVATPVAGYLYFPLPGKRRPSTLQMRYYGAKGDVNLILSVPRD